MPRLKIISSQNVTIDYELSTVMERVISGAFDVFVQFVYSLIVLTSLAQSRNLPEWSWLLLLLPVILYSLFFEMVFNGRTPGKMIFGIRVIRIDGRRAGFSSFFIRWVFRLIDVYSTAGAVAISSVFFSSKAQRTGDIVAGTTIVRSKIRPVYNPLFQIIPANYVIKYPQVKMLSEKDILTISELLNYNRKLDSVKVGELMQTTRKKLETMLGIQSEGRNEIFLQTILRDYSAVNREQINSANRLPF